MAPKWFDHWTTWAGRQFRRAPAASYLLSSGGEHCSLSVTQQLRQTKVRDSDMFRSLYYKYAINKQKNTINGSNARIKARHLPIGFSALTLLVGRQE